MKYLKFYILFFSILLISKEAIHTQDILDRYDVRLSIEKLSIAQTANELKESYKTFPYRDILLDVIYYTRLRELAHSKDADIGLLKTIPKNERDFWYLYRTTDPRVENEISILGRIFNLYSYYKTLSELVIKHPKFIANFLRLSYFADGEIAELFNSDVDGLNQSIFKKSPKCYIKALRSLPKKAQQRICGDCKEEIAFYEKSIKHSKPNNRGVKSTK